MAWHGMTWCSVAWCGEAGDGIAWCGVVKDMSCHGVVKDGIEFGGAGMGRPMMPRRPGLHNDHRTESAMVITAYQLPSQHILVLGTYRRDDDAKATDTNDEAEQPHLVCACARTCSRACVDACMPAVVCACVRAGGRACGRAGVCVRACVRAGGRAYRSDRDGD